MSEPLTEREHRWRNEVRRCQHERDAAEARANQLAKQLSRAHENESIERERAERTEAALEAIASEVHGQEKIANVYTFAREALARREDRDA